MVPIIMGINEKEDSRAKGNGIDRDYTYTQKTIKAANDILIKPNARKRKRMQCTEGT